MITQEYEIKDPCGLHARPATLITKICMEYSVQVWIEREGEVVAGPNTIALMALYVKPGDRINICVEGVDEKVVAKKIIEVLDTCI